MQQIADWLEKLGMSKYAQRFAESDIDIDALSELTDQDFDRLGVSLRQLLFHRWMPIRAPKASSSATRPGQALGYFYLDAKLPSFSWARSQVPGSSAINGMLAGLDPHSSYTCSR
jgi:SAM domain (Sterile alpha motif)